MSTLSVTFFLKLDGNDLTGTIPPELGQLAELDLLDLCKLCFDYGVEVFCHRGQFSHSFTAVPLLSTLLFVVVLSLKLLGNGVADNHLSLTLPTHLGKLSKLQRLVLRKLCLLIYLMELYAIT